MCCLSALNCVTYDISLKPILDEVPHYPVGDCERYWEARTEMMEN